MSTATVQPKSKHGEADAAPSRLARLVGGALSWVRGHRRLAAGLALAASMVVVPGLVILISWPSLPPPEPLHLTVAMAFEALERGDVARAAKIASRLERSGEIPLPDSGGPAFVLGAIASQNADSLLGNDQAHYRDYAARKLLESYQAGFPASRQAEGQLLLGKNLFLAGRLTDSVTVFESALELNPARAAEIHRYLATALLLEATPATLAAAKNHNAHLLADPSLAAEDVDEALLQLAEIQLRQNDFAGCEATRARILPESPAWPRAELIGARVLLTQAAALAPAEAKPGAGDAHPGTAPDTRVLESLDAADGILARLATVSADMGDLQRHVLYWQAYASVLRGQNDTSLDLLSKVFARFSQTPEGSAAAFTAGDLLRRMHRDDDAVSAYEAGLGVLGPWEKLNSPWLSLGEARGRLQTAIDDLRKRREFDLAVRLARGFHSLAPRERGVELAADIQAQWGNELLTLAGKPGAKDPESAAKQGRALMRQAGEGYLELAELRVLTPAYVDDLWEAAESLRQGHGYKRASEIYREYLDAETRKRRPLALSGFAEAAIAQGRYHEALSALGECVTFFPNDPAVFRARILASQAYVERGEVDRAVDVLLDNLNGDLLRPASEEFRESLFALGKVLHDNGRYADAIAQLEHATERYPTDPAAVEAHYMLANSFDRLALELDTAEDAVTKDARDARIAKADARRRQAIEQYDKVLAELMKRLDRGELPPDESRLLRNCLFLRGAAFVGLRQYSEAITAYGAALTRYQDAPESLEAFTQIAECYRRLGQDSETRRMLLKAKAALRRLGPNAPFNETTNFSYAEWEQRLELIERL